MNDGHRLLENFIGEMTPILKLTVITLIAALMMSQLALAEDKKGKFDVVLKCQTETGNFDGAALPWLCICCRMVLKFWMMRPGNETINYLMTNVRDYVTTKDGGLKTQGDLSLIGKRG